MVTLNWIFSYLQTLSAEDTTDQVLPKLRQGLLAPIRVVFHDFSNVKEKPKIVN